MSLNALKLRLIFAFLIAGAIPELLTMGFSPLTPFLIERFVLTEVHIGLLSASMGAGSLVLSVSAGHFVDVRGSRTVLMASVFVAVLSFMALSLAGGFYSLFVVFFLAGSFRPFSDIASTKATMLAVPGPDQTTAVGIVHVGPSLASVATSALLPGLITVIGWRSGLQLTGVLLLPVGWWVCRSLVAQGDLPLDRQAHRGRLFVLLRNPGFSRCLIVWGSFMSGNFAFLSFFILHLTAVVGLRPSMAGGVLALAQVVAMIGRPLWGVISNRFFGGRRIRAALIMGVIATVVFAALALLPREAGALIPAVIAIGAGASIMSSRPVATTLAVEYVPQKDAGRALALLSLVTWTVAMVLPPLMGWIITYAGSWTWAWMVSAIIAGGSIPALLSLPPSPVRPEG